jgi:FKBP-type peptidyl-prolyl cis-trans isomerase FkpA
MRYCMLLIVTLFSSLVYAGNKDSTFYYALPDSVKATSLLVDVRVDAINGKNAINGKRQVSVGIRNDKVSLALTSYGSKWVSLSIPANSATLTTGIGVWQTKSDNELRWNFDWKTGETYKLMLSIATDSAGNYTLYSGYVWLPADSKWKLIGTVKQQGQWKTLQQPAHYYTTQKKYSATATFSNPWCQRQNGSWKKMDAIPMPPPTVNLLSHIDSIAQFKTDIRIIEEAIATGKTDAKEKIEDIYYKIINPGTGRPVSVNDTVTVHYKGYIFPDGEVFDQTKEKPATFPLKRLIRGWQIAVPLLKVGGKIRIVIPSAQAYSIRTRAAKIPPNSILVFEVEVLDAKN